jgi:flagellar motor switch protein FliN/FliY
MADENLNPNPEQAAATPPPTDAESATVEAALNDAQHAVDDLSAAFEETGLPGFGSGEPVSGVTPDRGMELLGDVDLDVSIELGRTEMLVEDVLKLKAGSVVELDKLAGDPVDVFVNGRLVARGEVLVLNDNFCIRVSEIVADLEEQAEAAKAEIENEIQPTAQPEPTA